MNEDTNADRLIKLEDAINYLTDQLRMMHDDILHIKEKINDNEDG